MMQVWYVAFWENEEAGRLGIWQLVGIFSTRERALAACKDRRFGMAGPIALDELAPEEPTCPPGACRPNMCEPVGV